jgi:hypothetical protein
MLRNMNDPLLSFRVRHGVVSEPIHVVLTQPGSCWLLLVLLVLLTVRVHPSSGFCATNKLANFDGSVAQLAGLGILGFSNPTS